MARVDETLVFQGELSELHVVPPPLVGVRSMGETHYGDTHFGESDPAEPHPAEPHPAEPHPAEHHSEGQRFLQQRVVHRARRMEGAAGPPEAQGRSAAALPRASSALSGPLSVAPRLLRRLKLVPAPSTSLRLGAWMLVGGLVGGGAAASLVGGVGSWKAERAAVTAVAGEGQGTRDRASDSSTALGPGPAGGPEQASRLQVEVVDPAGAWVSGASVRLGEEVTQTTARGPLPVALPPMHGDLLVECPKGMRGGPLVRSFNPRLLPAGRALRVILTCRPILQNLPFHFSSGECESTVSLSTGEVFETEGGILEETLELDVEALGQVRVDALLQDENCRFVGPGGPSREETRVLALDEVESVHLQMQTERVRPRSSWQRQRPTPSKRPYRL